jgi:peptidoglycan/xylan/chitin deacetylase (PgdA/CDA1 family)
MVNGPASSHSVCLTFDDGPDPQHTPHLLDLLRQHEIAATFFVIGQCARRHPQLVRRIAAEGHAIGQHSFTHSEPGRTSTRQLIEEIKQTQDVLGDILGNAPTLFRPPKGALTMGKLHAILQAGLTVVLWNVDPKDYACHDAAALQRWFSAHPLRGGDVVLMHDVKPWAADVIPYLAAQAKAADLAFAIPLQWHRTIAGGVSAAV